jgi:hypothetical protein
MQFFNNTSKAKIAGLTFITFFIISVLNLAIGYFASWVIMRF